MHEKLVRHVAPGSARVIHSARMIKATAQTEPFYGDEISHPWDNDRGDLIQYYTGLSGYNAYHSRCLRVKADCSVNLGIDVVSGDEDVILNRLENVNVFGNSFQEVMSRVALDYETTGNGYVEVVRDKAGRVAELYHCPATLVTMRPRSAETPYYYRNESTPVAFQRFIPGSRDANSLVHFSNHTQADRYYGLPDWRGAVPDIELNYYATLYNQHFFINSGVPDMAIIVEGGKFDEATENSVVTFFQENFKGVANAHRTLYLPIENTDIKVRFEKLAMEIRDRDGSFEKLRASCRDNIVSAHGVPPRLVGIVAGGQLGGGGEIHGQFKMFQEITIGPRQNYFETKLQRVVEDMGFPGAVFRFSRMDTSIQEADSTYYPAMISAGILSVDEAREEMGYGMRGDADKDLPIDGDEPVVELVKSLERFRKAVG